MKRTLQKSVSVTKTHRVVITAEDLRKRFRLPVDAAFTFYNDDNADEIEFLLDSRLTAEWTTTEAK